MSTPAFLENDLYSLLRAESVKQFNLERPEGAVDLKTANLRGCDLRGAELSHVDLTGAYLRGADLRGLDLSQTNLRGASLADAKVSGVLFPAELPAAEIHLSITQGTRLRY